jgi:hypothetical protein
MGRPVFLPVEDKFRNSLLRKLTIYVGHLQYIVDRFFWLPLRGHGTWHCILFHYACVKLPLSAHMLNKF